MVPLSSATENRLIILGLGITTCAVFGLMRHLLISYRDSVEVKQTSQKTQYITQGTEDALRPATLEKLIKSHNYDIQEIASRIVLDRAIHDDATLDVLLWELTRPDHDRRERAIRAVYMLMHMKQGMKGHLAFLPYFLLFAVIFLLQVDIFLPWIGSQDYHLRSAVAAQADLTRYLGLTTELNSPKVYNAIVRSLEYSITDVPHDAHEKDFDNFDFRDVAERICLLALLELVDAFGPEELLKAGFVSKWLAKEPWGTAEKERQATFEEICGSEGQNTRISQIVVALSCCSSGLRKLRDAKLLPEETSIIDTRMVNGEGTAGETRPRRRRLFRLPVGDPRLREQSAEERYLRRRHREAMVLSDGGRPIVGSDIIERDYETNLYPMAENGDLIEDFDFDDPLPNSGISGVNLDF